jgi:N-acetylglucosamine-6-phosphate deacetylase
VQALINASVYTPRRVISEGVVLFDERIIAVGTPQQVPVPGDADVIDAGGQIVCPGYVDMHVHGGDGADSNDGDADAVRALSRRHLRAGTTSLLPTTSSCPMEQLWRAFDSIVAVRHAPRPDEARVLGIHAESNFFALTQAGAHNPALLRMPDAAERERLLSYAPELERLSLAPERQGALELIGDLAARDVLVAGAHSDALYEQVCLAMQAGLSHITHLWSSMSTVRRIGPKRHAGMLEAGLVEEGLTGEIIADGYHLPSSLIKMAYRMKGPEKLCLISDAMRASGCGPGQYEVGGLKAFVDEGGGVAVTEDRKAFAGSISTVGQCLQHVVNVVGLALVDALEMATLTPARLLGRYREVGQLAPGCHADLLVLDRASLLPRMILLGGKAVAL